MSFPAPTDAAIAALAPTGTLRAGINLSNFLLVTGRSDEGDPVGVSPDMARALADTLGVGVELHRYKTPAALADDAPNDAWDIGNIGAEPQRAAVIDFTAAYCEIECTYLVPAGSDITSIDQVDQPGHKIASADRSAYGLWLDNNIRHAELFQATGLDGAVEAFLDHDCDALAGLRPGLGATAEQLPGSRLLEGRFTAVQQAMGTPKGRDQAGIDYLKAFVEAAKASGFVADAITRHGVEGRLSVAAPASTAP